MKNVQVPAILEKITTLKDGSVRLLFETQELDAANCTILLGMRLSLGWLIFAPQEQREFYIPDEKLHRKDEKTPSQRLRGALFVLWDQKKPTASFNEFYESKMSGFIEGIKEQIEPNNYF